MGFVNTNGVTILEFPARSPDLNPIEHEWDELGRRLKKRQHQPGSVPELAQALQEEWNNILIRRIRALYLSMRSRLRACEIANGGHTRY
jgi:transposase